MLPECSPAVARALQSAHVYAVREGKTEREPLHILHALLEEEEGLAAVLLHSARGSDGGSLPVQRVGSGAGAPGRRRPCRSSGLTPHDLE